MQYINKIKHGMTTQQVVSIMGKPDHVQIETLIDSIEFSYYYENAIIAAGNAVVAFKHVALLLSQIPDVNNLTYYLVAGLPVVRQVFTKSKKFCPYWLLITMERFISDSPIASATSSSTRSCLV